MGGKKSLVEGPGKRSDVLSISKRVSLYPWGEKVSGVVKETWYVTKIATVCMWRCFTRGEVLAQRKGENRLSSDRKGCCPEISLVGAREGRGKKNVMIRGHSRREHWNELLGKKGVLGGKNGVI